MLESILLEILVLTIIIAGVVVFILAIYQLYKDNCDCNRRNKPMKHNNKRKSLIESLFKKGE